MKNLPTRFRTGYPHMYFRALTISFIFISQLCYSQGRKPAVEDFVGIEIEHPEESPQGTETLFNFEQDMSKFETPTKQKTSTGSAQKPMAIQDETVTKTTALAITFFLSLPALIWFIMMKNLKHKAQVASASNIEVLENYRREKEKAKKAEEELKKAS
jgi:hypothetical protein